ncbi:MAG: EutP/PduV family microcompartment system protein [Eubacterium sp.]|nr:EutP/PduV family microcompartment system protein [Eubacterium sp.]
MASNRNRVALVGKIGSGKTTLMQRLSQQEIHYAKTQMVTYTEDFIDTPGEFIEMPFFCRQAINVSCDAGLIIVVVSSSDTQNTIPPNFVYTFNVPAIGVITKIDREDANLKRSYNALNYAGVNKKKIFEVSAYTGEGIEALEQAIHSYIERKK